MALALGGTASARAEESNGTASYYHPMYEGSGMRCGDPYHANDPSIAAVGPTRYDEWPCDTRIRISGPAGELVVIRADSCPACRANDVDLSEAGFRAVCGPLSIGRCAVSVTVLR